MPGDNTIAKTGCESLDLRFDLIRHTRAAVERNVAVSPERVLTRRRARFIEHTLFADHHERTPGIFPARNIAFGRRNFVNAVAEMNRACATTSFGFPWDRLTQRIIDFENSRRVSK